MYFYMGIHFFAAKHVDLTTTEIASTQSMCSMQCKAAAAEMNPLTLVSSILCCNSSLNIIFCFLGYAYFYCRAPLKEPILLRESTRVVLTESFRRSIITSQKFYRNLIFEPLQAKKQVAAEFIESFLKEFHNKTFSSTETLVSSILCCNSSLNIIFCVEKLLKR